MTTEEFMQLVCAPGEFPRWLPKVYSYVEEEAPGMSVADRNEVARRGMARMLRTRWLSSAEQDYPDAIDDVQSRIDWSRVADYYCSQYETQTK